RAAIAQQALEDVARQALAVNAHQYRLGLNRDRAVDVNADSAEAQRQVGFGIDDRRVWDQVERAEPGRQLQHQLAMDQPFALSAELDQVLDGAQLQTMLLAKLAEIRQAGHVAVGRHDLDDHRRLLAAGQPGEIDAPFGMAGADQNAAGAGADTRDMPL